MRESNQRFYLCASLLIVSAFASNPSFAISAVQKAKANQQVKDAADKAKKACGIGKLDATINWDAFEKIKGETKDQVVAAQGEYAAWGLECLERVCTDTGKDAALYKAEAKKIAKYVAMPEVREDNPVKYTKKGTTLTGGYRYDGGNNSNCPDDLKALF